MPGRRQRPDAVAAALRLAAPARAEEELRVRGQSRLAEGMHGETLLASSLVDCFRVENEGKRAAILGLVGCQRARRFAPGLIGTGQIGPGKSPGSTRERLLPK